MSVAIVGGERAVARVLATHLADRGTPAVTIGDGDHLSASHELAGDLTSAQNLLQRFDEASAILGEPPALVRLASHAAQSIASELAATALEEWVTRAETPLREVLAFHQAAQRFLAQAGGRIVLVVPTIGLSGSPGYVPWATTAEADRSMLKAQARVGGALGITLNAIAVSSSLLAGTDDDLDRGGLPALALPEPGLGDLAALIAALLGPTFRTVTGQTIGLDGGRWMAP